MSAQMKGTWTKWVGTALLWAALSALVYVPSSATVERGVLIACLGFLAFCCGVALVADSLKRDIVAELRRERST